MLGPELPALLQVSEIRKQQDSMCMLAMQSFKPVLSSFENIDKAAAEHFRAVTKQTEAAKQNLATLHLAPYQGPPTANGF
jgi:hypothetical protein